MKKKEDIANVIKQKLHGMASATSQPSWEAVAASLERRKKKRVAFWWLGSAMSILLIFLFVQNFNNDPITLQTDDNNQNESSVTKTPTKNLDGPNTRPTLTDSLSATTKSKEASMDLVSDSATPTKNINDENNASVKQISVTEFDSVDFMQGAEVKTTYYYYRDSDNTEIITQNKKVLDSLLNDNATNVQFLERGQLKTKDSLK